MRFYKFLVLFFIFSSVENASAETFTVHLDPITFNLKSVHLLATGEQAMSHVSCDVQSKTYPEKRHSEFSNIVYATLSEELNSGDKTIKVSIPTSIDMKIEYNPYENRILWCDLFVEPKFRSLDTGLIHDSILSPYKIDYQNNPSAQIENYFNGQTLKAEQSNGFERIMIYGKNGEVHQISLKQIEQ